VTQPASSTLALEARGITKHFGTVTALDQVDFSVRRGTVHALLGENGAGKTTLMRAAYGMVPLDAGSFHLLGQPMRRHTVRDANRAGVGMVHQHLSLVPALTAAENLALGRPGLYRPRDARAQLQRLADSSGLRVPADAPVRDLSIVERQRLEILKALGRGARLLILDEPTAVLAPSEIDDLLEWIRRFVAQGGSVVLVTHKLREALAVAHDVTILRRGRVVYTGDARQSSEKDLARAMFPENVDATPTVAASPAGGPVVQARDLTLHDAARVTRIRNATFDVRAGEIVGIAAVEGSGHRALLRALAALDAPSAGSLTLPRRIAHVPADRLNEALIPDFSLAENVALRGLGARRGVMPWPSIVERTTALIERFGVVAPGPRARARTLSGGNQQRLVIARELDQEIDLLVADNPTRGLDLSATVFVHEQLRRAAVRGTAVVVHSSDVDEVLSLATRVLVVFHGEVREVAAARDEVGRAMLGAAGGAGAAGAAGAA
jgi:simple sugar transport system ATP-binding protein